jgi:hypothetical protein
MDTKMMGRVSSRFTYANMVASLALFVSLGGASYAAMVLPAGSVGSKQLRAHAVTPGTLGFPLGAVGVATKAVDDLVKGACNSPLRPGQIPPPCLPPTLAGATQGREVHIRLQSSGSLVISAIAGLKNEDQPHTEAHVTFTIAVDGRAVTESTFTSSGGESRQVPIQALINVAPGSHTAGLAIWANYNSNAPGDILISPVSVVITALPRA